MALTIKQIAKLTKKGRYLDGHGLYLQVKSAESRSWLLRYQLNGTMRWMGLGPLKAYSLDEARELARQAHQLLFCGVDPIIKRRAEQEHLRTERLAHEARNVSFAECAERYFEQHHAKWKNAKHRAQFLSTLRQYAFPHIGKCPVGEIDEGAVLGVLDPIWHSKPETANRVRMRIEAVLGFATLRGFRTGENPARWKGHLDHALPGRGRLKKPIPRRALDFRELPAFIVDLRQREGIAAKALEFTILTAARTIEVTGARWEEIDVAAGLWTVPAQRMKGGRDHRVPLTPSAISLLKSVPTEKGNPFIFAGIRNRNISNMAMDAVLRRMGRKEIATVHGFRATFKTWADEATNFAPETVEAALAHLSGDKVEQAYRRGDMLEKRRQLMDAWDRYVQGHQNASENVYPIRQAG